MKKPLLTVGIPAITILLAFVVNGLLAQIPDSPTAAPLAVEGSTPKPDVDALNSSELKTLQEEYAKIMQNKAALMNLEELKAAVAAQRKELAELKAKKELLALRDDLNILIKKYPESQAAKQATMMLKMPAPNLLPVPVYYSNSSNPIIRGSQSRTAPRYGVAPSSAFAPVPASRFQVLPASSAKVKKN